MSLYDPRYSPQSVYSPYSAYSYGDAYSPQVTTAWSYPATHSIVSSTGGWSHGRGVQHTGHISERIYFDLNGKLIRAPKIRSYRRAQKHVLSLYPEMLQGVASSRVQFYVLRPGYSRGEYINFRSYISREAWAAEVDRLAEHETIGIDIRPSLSIAESISSFFNRGRVF
ncbi:hypothetical protein BC834DRAFT_884992 [Gloeopeniophorella convolvens]|nr:hypothetical protein BC834DRAFT_884992 [Gloeopeniophorella convolvens]